MIKTNNPLLLYGKVSLRKAITALVLIAATGLILPVLVLAGNCYEKSGKYVCCGPRDGSAMCCEGSSIAEANTKFNDTSLGGCRFETKADRDAIANMDNDSDDASGDDSGSGDDASGDDSGSGDETSEVTEVDVTFENPIFSNTLNDVINNLSDFVFTIALIVGPLVIIIGGFIFVTAGGDPKKVETGKKVIYWALIGIGIAILAKGLVLLLRTLLTR